MASRSAFMRNLFGVQWRMFSGAEAMLNNVRMRKSAWHCSNVQILHRSSVPTVNSVAIRFIVAATQTSSSPLSNVIRHLIQATFEHGSCRVQWLMFKRFLITKFKSARHVITVWNASKSIHSLIKMSPLTAKHFHPRELESWAQHDRQTHIERQRTWDRERERETVIKNLLCNKLIHTNFVKRKLQI